MKYTIRQFRKDFPDDDACLQAIFNNRYSSQYECPKCHRKGKFHKITGRKRYDCQCGFSLHPLAKTIFHKSETPLRDWFYAVFLMASSRNGVSAMELQRQLGVTYKTAWRMNKQIRSILGDDGDKLSGIIEADETYVGGYRRGGQGGKDKTPVLGLVQRGGAVKVVVSRRETHLVLNHMRKNVEKGSKIYTEQFGVYRKAVKLGYEHGSINHWRKEFARGDVHTNTIEGFWSQLKRSLNGTYHAVSPKYLQAYVDEFSFRYSNRTSRTSMFELMLGQVVKRVV